MYAVSRLDTYYLPVSDGYKGNKLTVSAKKSPQSRRAALWRLK